MKGKRRGKRELSEFVYIGLLQTGGLKLSTDKHALIGCDLIGRYEWKELSFEPGLGPVGIVKERAK